MVLIGTTDLENVPNALRFHAKHKEHCLGLYEQNTRLPIQLSALWHRLIRLSCRRQEIYARISTGGTSMDMATPFPALKSDRHVRFWH